MASYIEVKIGTKVYRHDFTETDTQVRGALARFAKSQEPPLADTATVDEQLADAVEKIIDTIGRISAMARLNELRDEQTANLEEQARTEGGLSRR